MNFKTKLQPYKLPDGALLDKPTFPSVTEYMVPISHLVTFRPDQDLNEAMVIMIHRKISGAPVLDQHQRFIGMISEKDCLHRIFSIAYKRKREKASVAEYMSKEIKTISAEANVLDAAETFLNSNFRRLPVINGYGELIGQISRRDILQAALDMDAR